MEYNLKTPPGFYEDMPIDVYHADPAIGSSGLKKFMECPALYHAHYVAEPRIPYGASRAQRIGSHAHVRLLEPDKFVKEFAISPEFAVVNKGKRNEERKPMNRAHGDWTEFCATVGNKTPLLHSEYLTAQDMAEAIMQHPLASKMLTGGREELSFFAKDESGLMVKSRPDYLINTDAFGVVLVDYKTTGLSLSTSKQSRNAFDLGRHIQAAHHKRIAEIATGGKINQVLYIAQMQEAPYLVRVFRMPEDAIQIGHDACRHYLDEMARCYEDGNFPSYPIEIEDYLTPSWLGNELN